MKPDGILLAAAALAAYCLFAGGVWGYVRGSKDTRDECVVRVDEARLDSERDGERKGEESGRRTGACQALCDDPSAIVLAPHRKLDGTYTPLRCACSNNTVQVANAWIGR